MSLLFTLFSIFYLRFLYSLELYKACFIDSDKQNASQRKWSHLSPFSRTALWKCIDYSLGFIHCYSLIQMDGDMFKWKRQSEKMRLLFPLSPSCLWVCCHELCSIKKDNDFTNYLIQPFILMLIGEYEAIYFHFPCSWICNCIPVSWKLSKPGILIKPSSNRFALTFSRTKFIIMGLLYTLLC